MLVTIELTHQPDLKKYIIFHKECLDHHHPLFLINTSQSELTQLDIKGFLNVVKSELHRKTQHKSYKSLFNFYDHTKRLQYLTAIIEYAVGGINQDEIIVNRVGTPIGFRDNTSEGYLSVVYTHPNIQLPLEKTKNYIKSFEGSDQENKDGTFGWNRKPISESKWYDFYNYYHFPVKIP